MSLLSSLECFVAFSETTSITGDLSPIYSSSDVRYTHSSWPLTTSPLVTGFCGPLLHQIHSSCVESQSKQPDTGRALLKPQPRNRRRPRQAHTPACTRRERGSPWWACHHLARRSLATQVERNSQGGTLLPHKA